MPTFALPLVCSQVWPESACTGLYSHRNTHLHGWCKHCQQSLLICSKQSPVHQVFKLRTGGFTVNLSISSPRGLGAGTMVGLLLTQILTAIKHVGFVFYFVRKQPFSCFFVSENPSRDYFFSVHVLFEMRNCAVWPFKGAVDGIVMQLLITYRYLMPSVVLLTDS